MQVSVRITNHTVTWVMTSWWWNNLIAKVTTQIRTSCATWIPFSWTPQKKISLSWKTPCLADPIQQLTGNKSRCPWSRRQSGWTLTMVMCSTPAPGSFLVPVNFRGKRTWAPVIHHQLRVVFHTLKSGIAVSLPTSINIALPVRSSLFVF